MHIIDSRVDLFHSMVAGAVPCSPTQRFIVAPGMDIDMDIDMEESSPDGVPAVVVPVVAVLSRRRACRGAWVVWVIR